MVKSLSPILMAFIAVTLGIVLVITIADQVSILNQDVDITNETIDISDGFNDTDFNTSMIFNVTTANANWVDSSVVIFDSTGASNSSEYTVDDATHGITFLNTSWVWGINTAGENNSGVNYSYYHANYLDNGSSRTLVGLVTLFFVIGLVIFILAFLMKGNEFMSQLRGR